MTLTLDPVTESHLKRAAAGLLTTPEELAGRLVRLVLASCGPIKGENQRALYNLNDWREDIIDALEGDV